MVLRSLLPVVALVLLLGPPVRAQEAPPPSTDALRDSIATVLESTNTPGAGVVLFSADSIRWEGYFGLADRAADRPVTAETVFRAGSVSKSFVSAAALRLVETGTLDLLGLALEDPIQRLGTPTVYSVGYAALTLAYGLTTLGGLWSLVRTRTTAYGPTWTYHLFVVGAELLVLVYFAAHGLIGHRFWT